MRASSFFQLVFVFMLYAFLTTLFALPVSPAFGVFFVAAFCVSIDFFARSTPLHVIASVHLRQTGLSHQHSEPPFLRCERLSALPSRQSRFSCGSLIFFTFHTFLRLLLRFFTISSLCLMFSFSYFARIYHDSHNRVSSDVCF